MSAFVVSKSHIDSLIAAAMVLRRDYLDFCKLDEIGQMLWNENHKSVNSRYNEKTAVPVYHYTGRPNHLTPVEVLKAVACLEYQSCEHEGWGESQAKKWLAALSEAAISALPGYEAAAWEVNS